MNTGYYSYIKNDMNIKTKYIIEFTRNKKIFDIMDTTKFNFDMLNKVEYDYLQDAITDYIKLYYDESILYVMLFEQVILNNEVILEQCKDMIGTSILPQEIKRQVKRVTQENENIKAELSQYQDFIKKYNAGNLFHDFKTGKQHNNK